MNTAPLTEAMTRLFSELTGGTTGEGGAFVLNSGDIGLLRSLDTLSAADASRSSHQGASIAAHARHLQYGLSLMNRWAREGGNPFADATWDAAWTTHDVTDEEWRSIRSALRLECEQWLSVLGASRDVAPVELTGMLGSIAHLGYHLGAIRQIHKGTRGPREGTFLP